MFAKLAFRVIRLGMHMLLIACGPKFTGVFVDILVTSDDEEYAFSKDIYREGPVKWYERLYADGAGLDEEELDDYIEV